MRHHLFALQVVGLVILCLIGAGFAAAGLVGFVWLCKHLAEHLPEWVWWVFWPSFGAGMVYWMGWAVSKEQEDLSPASKMAKASGEELKEVFTE